MGRFFDSRRRGMTVDDYVNVLLEDMQATQSTTLVDQLLKDARAQIRAGKGTIGTLTSSALNGKSFQREVQFTALETMGACNRALRAYTSTDGDDDGTVAASRPDFRGLIY